MNRRRQRRTEFVCNNCCLMQAPAVQVMVADDLRPMNHTNSTATVAIRDAFDILCNSSRPMWSTRMYRNDW